MSERKHAAGDGSFGRSAGGAGLRGALLLLVAFVLGVVLLNAFDDGGEPFDGVDVASGPTTTTASRRAVPPPTAAPTTAPLRPAGEVKVLPANGSSVKGAGGRIGEQLTQAGYNSLSPSNATSPEALTTTTVYFMPGYQNEATELATKVLGLPGTVVQGGDAPVAPADVRGANLVVVIGTDIANRTEGADTASTTTTSPSN